MIKAVLFDYGGVLCRGGGIGSVRAMLAGALGIAEEQVQDMGDAYRQLMTGRMSTEAFMQALGAAHPGATYPTPAALLADARFFERNPQVYALAERLRAAGIQTGILSNVFAFSADEMKRRGLFAGFEPVLLSCDTHVMKPDPAFYRMAVDQFGVPAHDILFIDDRREMLDAAAALGMQTLLAVTPDQIVADTTHMVREQAGIPI
jgi:epoxide hydrolase-like predicted phosphatase